MNNNQAKYSGFTMIELIVVIIMLAIMAISIAPKFLNSTGFQEYTYRDDVINTLRAIQLRAMQQTGSSGCNLVLVTTKGLGIPKNCIVSSGGWQSAATSVEIEAGHDVTFDVSSGNYSFTFDGMG